MKLSPWLRFAAFFWLAAVAWFVLLVAGVLASTAHAATADDKPPPPPWHLPRFDGADEVRDQPPAGALEPPPVLDARGLYDLVITCFPSPTWWKPEIALEGRYANQQGESNALVQTAETSTYAGIVARIPLYSSLELDREREREAMRRSLVAQNVGKIEQLLAARAIARRELGLWRAIEARSSRRVAAGVTETKEQIDAIAKVAGIESTLMTVAADLTAAKLLLVGMCVDRTDVEAELDRVIKDRP
ncbi:hypothetical protein [Thauera aminoaromatica]|uniref:Uncharacterized protein n=1 Tax=Thauera aminoaromatica TaxID=164330 RepID=B8F0D5_THASP|nr:hypothetical protein [Thauera aminoaromatica]ACK55101.1 conserved hypothetical protein [Thauera aminoaromatica]